MSLSIFSLAESHTTSELLLYMIIVFHLLETVFELYITVRQIDTISRTKTVPEQLQKLISPDTFAKARAYSFDTIRYDALTTVIFTLLIHTAEIYFEFLPFLWSLCLRITAAIGLDATNEIAVSCVFMTLTSIIQLVQKLPFSVYKTFVIEEKHGFNKQTAWFFCKDQLKAFVIGQIITLIVSSMAIYIVQIGGPHFYIWLWLFTGIVAFALLTIYPIFIAPLFDNYKQLEAGDLRSGIEALAQRLHFPLTKLYVVEGSKRSAHSNAYFYGLWNSKRIVLFDTLLADYVKPTAETDDKTADETPLTVDKKEPAKGCQNDEVIAVLAHELGHWKLNHVTKNICIGQLNILLIFGGFGYLFNNSELYRMFGFPDDQRPILIGLMLICNYVLAMYNAMLSFAVTMLSRAFEYQADEFAVKLGYAEQLGRALVKLNSDNLSFPVYDWLYSAWNHSHPTLLDRLVRLKRVEAGLKQKRKSE